MIYTTFKQWVRGRFLEIREPRKQAYSADELALIEMGWNYGYDAGVQWQKSQQALDKKAENARELGLDYNPEDSLHWHALNYRTASTQNAQAMFETLENFVFRQKQWVNIDSADYPDVRYQRETYYAGIEWAQKRLKDLNT